jgi:hypothetical protein
MIKVKLFDQVFTPIVTIDNNGIDTSNCVEVLKFCANNVIEA